METCAVVSILHYCSRHLWETQRTATSLIGCAGKSVAQGARTEKSCWEKLKPLGQKQKKNQAVPVNSSQHSGKPCFLLPWNSFFPAQHLILILDTAAEHDRVVKALGMTG